MKAAGYSQDYRQHVLQNALNIYDLKLRKNDEGITPLNRPKGYRKLERRKEKHQKKRNWSQKGGHVAPIKVPSTPGGLLAKMMRENEAEDELQRGVGRMDFNQSNNTDTWQSGHRPQQQP